MILGIYGFEESNQDAVTDELRKMSIACAKEDVNFVAPSKMSYSSTDAHQPQIVTVSKASSDYATGTGFTGGVDRDTSSCEHSSELAGLKSLLPQIGSSRSAGLRIGVGAGNVGPSIAVAGAEGARNIGTMVDQSPADCRRKIQEWKAETTSPERPLKGCYLTCERLR